MFYILMFIAGLFIGACVGLILVALLTSNDDPSRGHPL